ncbi:MAG: hypothetical protein ACPLZD_09870 [Candidatus Saccharicenans sp.]|nr:MAG: hypothetical protein C0168_02580 [Candidatus Aminicenantes bacterium]
MWLVNQAVGFIVKIALWPFIRLNPWAGMTFLSFLTALLVLFIYKKTSNQAAISQVKNQLKAHLLEMRLFQNDYRTILTTQKELLLANARYLILNLKPLLIMIIPVFLLLAQMNLWFNYRPVEPGETLLLKVRFINQMEVDRLNLNLEVPPEVTIDSPVLRIIDENEADWRLKIEGQSSQPLVIVVDGERYLKDIVIDGKSRQRISPRRDRRNLWLELLYPGEKPLPANSYIKEIELNYPLQRLDFLGIKIHWLVAYFLLSLIIGFALKKPLKVEI